ncbi:MAG TPA: amidohydrolase family protein [Myxococcota bacterium]|nr:amidohydrolase family protein [Myxococcota bacterium]
MRLLRRARVAWIALLVAGVLATARSVPAADLLIHDVRLIDGTGSAPRSHTSILIHNGVIAEIGSGLAAPGVPALEAHGATALPGLIDAHVHLGVVPGSGQRNDAPDLERRLRQQHLRSYLACGVTTVLDTGIAAETAREIQTWLAGGAPGPRFLTLGPGFTTPGGYLSELGGTVSTPAEVEAHFAVMESVGAVGAKVLIEPGFGPQPVWPILPPPIRDAIVRGAAKRKLPIYVHANREPDKAIALDMGARVIVHTGYYDSQPSDAFLKRMAASGAYLMTTFSIMDADLIRFHPERLEDPLLRLTVPALELATAKDPEAGKFLSRAEIKMSSPGMPALLQDALAWWFLAESKVVQRLQSSQQAARRFADAGVPIIVGSDSGNWPIVPYQFHGPTTLREIELLGQAGFAPMDVIASATRTPATMLGLEQEIGTVTVGKRADLVIVRDDPLQDLRALRTVQWTIKDGVARSPSEWMTP